MALVRRGPAVIRAALCAAVLMTAAALVSGGVARAAGGVHATVDLVPPGRPAQIMIPRIGVRASLESVPLSSDRDVEAPFRWSDAGWFSRGPRPGGVGRAVIFGHLDSTCCPAVFWSLKTLNAGDLVQVRYGDGQILTFRVLWQHTYPNATLPVRWVFGGGKGPRALLLYTCAGIFHNDGIGYDHKLVVYSRLVLPNGQLG
jgi:hypothetical protein